MFENVFIAPCANEQVRRQFLNLEPSSSSSLPKSIEGVISHNRISKFLKPKENEKLKEIFPDQKIRLWGTRLKKVWELMKIGDFVLFYKRSYYIAIAKVAFKVENEALARMIWEEFYEGMPWKYIFFIDEYYGLNLHCNALNEIAGYDKNFRPQGFMRVRLSASKKILQEIIYKTKASSYSVLRERKSQ